MDDKAEKTIAKLTNNFTNLLPKNVSDSVKGIVSVNVRNQLEEFEETLLLQMAIKVGFCRVCFRHTSPPENGKVNWECGSDHK